MKSLGRQEGGEHYKEFPVPPGLLCHLNGLGFLMGNVVKYAHRYEAKKNKQDLLKLIQYAEIAIEADAFDSPSLVLFDILHDQGTTHGKQ